MSQLFNIDIEGRTCIDQRNVDDHLDMLYPDWEKAPLHVLCQGITKAGAGLRNATLGADFEPPAHDGFGYTTLYVSGERDMTDAEVKAWLDNRDRADRLHEHMRRARESFQG